MYQRILVPLDGSPASEAGLREALMLARDAHAVVRLLHVIDEFALTLDFGSPEGLDNVRSALHRYGEEILDKARAQAAEAGVQAETSKRLTSDRRVAQAVLAEAEDWKADLIAMGTNGRRGFSHLLLGSEAELVARSSPVPVLLVRPRAA